MKLCKYGNGRVRVLITLVISIISYFHNSTIAYSSELRHIFNETPEQKAERLSWWTHDRFGMFIHFGLYSLPARGEWVKMGEQISEEKYDEYFKYFNPDLFDAKDKRK